MDVTPSLLITDDDRAFRETLDEAFRPRGYRTHLAADGVEALEIVRREPIHLLLVDMHMPRLTGLETLQAVKADRRELPCILVSAALDEEIRSQAAAADVFSILEKPVALEVVRRAVRDAFRQTYSWAGSL